MSRALPVYQVDAFTSTVFAGNPAAVCPLEEWLDDHTLQAIAAENNLSETAFLVPERDDYAIRWFTPLVEVSLCGHATLASAYVAFEKLGVPGAELVFRSRRSGCLPVRRAADLLMMELPVRLPRPIDDPPDIAGALGVLPQDAFTSEEGDLLVVLASEAEVRAVSPDLGQIAAWPYRGVIVTAPGDDCDFVSRFFAPAVGVPEDPVTGSAHCVLAPYWGERLGRRELLARQVSRRGGELMCEHRGHRVGIAGHAALYMEGTIYV